MIRFRTLRSTPVLFASSLWLSCCATIMRFNNAPNAHGSGIAGVAYTTPWIEIAPPTVTETGYPRGMRWGLEYLTVVALSSACGFEHGALPHDAPADSAAVDAAKDGALTTGDAGLDAPSATCTTATCAA